MRPIKDIQELRNIQMAILDNVHQFCEQHHLLYFLSSGTLIGAVRHKGYITWDDDIDIYMPRADYERFLQLYQDSQGIFKAIDPNRDSDYYYTFAKVIDTRTLMIEKETKGFEIGVYMDIFPVDYVTDNLIVGPHGTYFEIARCLNFWQESAVAPLSLQLEYNGGVYSEYAINNAFLLGLDYFVHSADFNNTFNFKLLYKHIVRADQKVPLQFTFVWGFQDLFGLKGLRFSGFADFWWEDHLLFKDHYGKILPALSHTVFLTEPQLWYSVGQFFGCPNLNIGGEVELSYDFGSAKGFWCRPCAGLKWVF